MRVQVQRGTSGALCVWLWPWLLRCVAHTQVWWWPWLLQMAVAVAANHRRQRLRTLSTAPSGFLDIDGRVGGSRCPSDSCRVGCFLVGVAVCCTGDRPLPLPQRARTHTTAACGGGLNYFKVTRVGGCCIWQTAEYTIAPGPFYPYPTPAWLHVEPRVLPGMLACWRAGVL